MNRIVGCLFWTFPWSFLTAQYWCKKKEEKKKTSWLSHHPPLCREVPFFLPAVLNSGRGYKPLVTPVWLFTDQNPSSAVFEGLSSVDPDKGDFFVAWRLLRRWWMPSSLHMAVLVVVWCWQIFKPLSFCFHKVNACWIDGVSYNALPFN